MRVSLKDYRERFIARQRIRWGEVFTEPGLTEFSASVWRAFVYARTLVVGVVATLVMCLVAQSRGLVPYPDGAFVAMAVAGFLCWWFFWFVGRSRLTAGRVLGFTDEEARTLDVYDPEKMAERVEAIRRARSERRA